MKSKYLEPTQDAIAKVMGSLVKQCVISGEVLTKKNNLAFGEVSSIITLSGESGTGSIAISFPLQVIMNLAELMLPKHASKDGQIIEDLSGEIGLMFAEVVKEELGKQDIPMTISKPVVNAGQPHYLTHAVQKPALLIPFISDAGTIFVELCFGSLKPSKKKAA